MSTLTVLEAAVTRKLIPDKAVMRDICDKLRSLDDGLPPIGRTRLLSPVIWS